MYFVIYNQCDSKTRLLGCTTQYFHFKCFSGFILYTLYVIGKVYMWRILTKIGGCNILLNMCLVSAAAHTYDVFDNL